MATISSTGITPTTLDAYVALIKLAFTNAFGLNINLDAETPEGQFIGNLALSFAQVDELAVDTVNAANINTAVGLQIDALAAALEILRGMASETEVDVQLTGVAATFIQVGSRAKDTQGNQYKLKESVTLNGSGMGSGTMVATVTGPLVVAANTLTQIVDVVPGWETINNSTPGESGKNAETDLQYKDRYYQSVKKNSTSLVDSIQATLLQIPTVQQAIVVENDTDSSLIVKGITLSPHSICAIVLGGTVEEVGTVIGRKKSPGCNTNGDQSYSYTPPNSPVTRTYYFYRAEPVPIAVNLTIKTASNFPSNGLAQIKKNLVAYFNGLFEVAPGYDTTGQQIGEDVIYTRLFTPINQIIGFEVTAMTIGPVGDSPGTIDIPINLNQLATLDTNDIDITVS